MKPMALKNLTTVKGRATDLSFISQAQRPKCIMWGANLLTSPGPPLTSSVAYWYFIIWVPAMIHKTSQNHLNDCLHHPEAGGSPDCVSQPVMRHTRVILGHLTPESGLIHIDFFRIFLPKNLAVTENPWENPGKIRFRRIPLIGVHGQNFVQF